MLATLETTRPLFTSYLRIRSTASSASSPELISARNELETNLQDLSTDLQDLIDSVRAAEKDPFRYGLEIEEVGRRGRLVEEVGGEIADMREELLKAVAGNKGRAAGDALPDPSAFDAEGDDYSALEQQRQVEIMHEQDEALDDVFKTVGTLRQQADVMGRELEEQGEMLDEVDTLTDRVGDKLKGGMKRLNTIVRKNEGLCSPIHSPIGYSFCGRSSVQLLYWSSDFRPHIATNPCHCSVSEYHNRLRVTRISFLLLEDQGNSVGPAQKDSTIDSLPT